MSERELHRLEVIQKLLDKRLTQAQAAEQLYLSARQIRRLIAAYSTQVEDYIKQHGKPVAFYSDKLGVFRVNQKSPQLQGDGITQFGRALKELNIDVICANTCQAKGRVERANKTLQDRLVKELRLRNISTVEAANAYLPAFIQDFNNRFQKQPLSDYNAHRPLLPHEKLKDILCWKEERTVSNSLTVQYDKRLYMLEDTIENRKLRRKRVTIYDYPDCDLQIYFEHRKLNFSLFYDRIQRIETGDIICNKRLGAALEFIKEQQQNLNTKRSQSAPSRTHVGIAHAKVKNI